MTVRRFPPRSAGPIPELHRPVGRVLIEELCGWRVLGENRRAAGYAEAFACSRTPVQLARWTEDDVFVSLISPCVQTEGRFELYVGGLVQRACCCSCAYRRLVALDDGLFLPPPSQWLVYVLDGVRRVAVPSQRAGRARQ